MKRTKTIWPWWVRLSHWLVAFGIFFLWIMAYFYYETDEMHRLVGYIITAVVLLRVLAACRTHISTAKLSRVSLHQIQTHISELRQRKVVRHDGHNPLGQLAVYCMWMLILLLAFSGWISRTDKYWGEDWPVNLHLYLSYALLGLVALHLIAVYLVSRLTRQHLLKQMIDGQQHWSE